MIATLEFRGFKIPAYTLTLRALNLILGTPGTGKTAILQVLQFAFLGHVPSLGKAEIATAAAMDGDELFVKIVLSDGRYFTRALRREFKHGKVSYRSIAACSWIPEEATTTEHHGAIVRLVGANETDAAENLDTRQLFACTPSERTRRLQGLLDASALTPETIANRAGALYRSRLSTNCAAQPNDVKEGDFGTVRPDVRAIATEVLAKLHAGLELGIGKADEAMNAEKLAQLTASRSKRAARQEIEGKLHDLGAPADAAIDLRARRDTILAERAKASRDVGLAKANAEHRRQAEAQVATFTGLEATAREAHQLAMAALPRAQELRAQAATIDDPADVIAEPAIEADAAVLARAAELDAQAEAIADPPELLAVALSKPSEDVLARAGELLSAATEAERMAGLIVIPEKIDTMIPELAVTRAERDLALAKESPWREVENEVRSICRFLGRDGPDAPADEAMERFDRILAIVVMNGGFLPAIEKALTDAKTALDLAVGDATIRDEAIIETRSQHDALLATVKRNRTDADEMRRGAHAAAEEMNRKVMEASGRAAVTRRMDLADAQDRRKGLREMAARVRAQAQTAAKGSNDASRARYADAFAKRSAALSENSNRRQALLAQATKIEHAAQDAQIAMDKAASERQAAEAIIPKHADLSRDILGSKPFVTVSN